MTSTADRVAAGEAGLAANGDLLRLLIDRSQDLVAAVDEDFRLLACNRAFGAAWQELFRAAPGVGGSPLQLPAGAERQRRELELGLARALQGLDHTLVHDLGLSPGPQRSYEIHYGYLEYRGAPAAFLVARDVSHRLRTEREVRELNAALEARVQERTLRLERANQRLRERDERLRAALEASNTGTFRRDLVSGLAFWDENLQRLLGLVPDDIPRSLAELLQIVHPEDRGWVESGLRHANAQGEGFEGVFRIVRVDDGQVRWLYHKSRIMRDESGQRSYAAGACCDITALKQAELAVEAREVALREIADSMPVIVWTRSVDNHLEYINQRWCEYTGMDLEATRTCGWESMVHPEDLSRVREKLGETIGRGLPFEAEYRFRRNLDGRYRWHLVRTLPVLDDDGRVLRWHGSATDIEDQIQTRTKLEEVKTELQRANRDLALSLAQLEAIINSMTEGLVVFDAQGQRLGMNPAARRLYGIDPQANARKSLQAALEEFQLTCVDGEPLPREQWLVVRALGGESFSGEERVVRRLSDGVEWIASFSGAPVYDGGELIYALLTIRDVTARVEGERALQAAVDARDRFLSIASHELRTPLTTLIMQLQMARRRVREAEGVAPSPQELAKALDASNRQAQRLARLVDDLLDVSRIQSGRLDFHLQPCDLVALVQEVVAQFAPTLERAGCRLTLDLPRSLEAHCDRARMEQVLGNLLSNVVKYAAGAPLEIRLKRRGGRVVLTVRDGGPGIPAEAQGRIFERFERCSDDRAVTGLGLGLYLVRQIVAGHAGEVRVESDGAGTAFWIDWPLRADAG